MNENVSSQWNELAHFLYGRGFWYADPLREIKGLTEEQLHWVPDRNGLSILWQVGHIAHRERFHIAKFLQGQEGILIPPQYEVFGPDWCSVEDVRSAGPVSDILAWVREVREKSHEYISSLTEADWHRVPPTSEEGLTVAHWVFITVAHTALHIGRIQLLRAMIERKLQRAC